MICQNINKKYIVGTSDISAELTSSVICGSNDGMNKNIYDWINLELLYYNSLTLNFGITYEI